MFTPTPAVRAALVGVVLLTLAALAGAGLHLLDAEARARADTAAALTAQATTLAAALAAVPPDSLTDAPVLQTLSDGQGAVVFDRDGAVMATSSPALARAVHRTGTERAAQVRPGADVVVDGRRQLVAVRPIGATGRSVAVASPAPRWETMTTTLGNTAAATVAIWGGLVGLLVLMAWYTGPRAAARLELLGERIAQGDADPDALIRHAQTDLGPLATAFQTVARKLRIQTAAVAEHRAHVGALYQVNPSYVVLCTFDGRVIEANPAFYAVTGLPPEILRNGPIAGLRDTFPIEPLMELAERSLDEGAAISGVEYALVTGDDETRPVEVSLRAFHLGETPVVILQATDLAARRRLEGRVAAFSDTLDLMVDQRVAELTAGQQALRTVLDAAGVVVASFDAAGGTRRWSGAARDLTGRAAAQVPHFTAVVGALGLSDADRSAFTLWFWNLGDDPFVADHAALDADGRPAARRFVWRKVDAAHAGRADYRTLVGLEVPVDLAAVVTSGDGLAGASPPTHGVPPPVQDEG